MALINYITTIQFDFNAITTLSAECARVGITRPLIVTDSGIRALGLLQAVTESIGGLPHTLYDGTPPNPNEESVRAGVVAYLGGNCDGVIAFGGGSSMDLAKGVALIATHGGALKQYAAIEGGVARITPKVAPVIAIPTTAGTGSEVGRGAVLILDDGRKVGILSPHLVPRAAICDPEFTMGLPPGITAATGMDAIAHCIETFLAPAFNPPADGIALDGLERGWAHLPSAVMNPGDREARRNMMSASMQGALAFQKGLGCVHSLSHSLGGLNPKLHHGTLNAVFLPAVIRFNASAPSVVSDRRMARLAHAMGLRESVDPANAIADAIRVRNADIGLPGGLTAMGVTSEMYPNIVARALTDHCHLTNPRLATASDYMSMLQQSAE